MARALRNIRLCIAVDGDGNPQSAQAQYEVYDDAAPEMSKGGTLAIDSPDFTKTFHDTGVAGEFWEDMIADIEAAEGIV